MDLRPHRPLTVAVSLLLAAAALAAMAAWAGCGRTVPLAPPAAAVRPVAATPRPASPPPLTSTPAVSRSAVALQAAAVVRRLTRLVAQGRVRAARLLLSRQRVWPRRELKAIHYIEYLSARVWGDPSAGSVTMAVRVRLVVGHDSPLTTGITTLFFTLGRDGASGDWLVTAVATSP